MLVAPARAPGLALLVVGDDMADAGPGKDVGAPAAILSLSTRTRRGKAPIEPSSTLILRSATMKSMLSSSSKALT